MNSTESDRPAESDTPGESDAAAPKPNAAADPSDRPGPKPMALALGAIAIIAVAAIAVIFSGGSSNAADDKTPAGGSGEAVGLQALRFVDENGTEGSLADFEGQALVVNFFASWCAPCRAELPDFQEVHVAAQDRVQFVGISHDIDESSWLSLVQQTGLTFPTRFQPEQEIWESLDLFGMPSTAFIDADGDVVHTFSGILNQETLIELIDEHLNVEV